PRGWCQFRAFISISRVSSPSGFPSEAMPRRIWRLTRQCSRIWRFCTGTLRRGRLGPAFADVGICRRPGSRPDRRLYEERLRASATAGLPQSRDAREMRVFRADHTLQDEELAGLTAWWLG